MNIRNLKKGLLLLLLLCVFSVQSIAEESSEEPVYYIYYLNKDATQLEKTAYLPTSSKLMDMVGELITKIGSKNSEERECNLLPQEVSVNSYDLLNRVLVIDFNSQYEKMSRTREILVRAGLMKNFVQFDGIDAIRITVIGEPLTDSKRQLIGDMSENSFVEYSGTQDQKNYRPEILTLYFTNAEGTGLVKENRKVYYKPTLQKEKVVLEQVIKGPMEKGNYPTLAENISVLNISTSDGICYISLTPSFIDSALPLDEQIPIYSIVNSLIDSCQIERVELSVEGDSDRIFGESMSLYQFYEKNEELVLQPEENPEDTAQ